MFEVSGRDSGVGDARENAVSRLVQFCQRHYYAAFVLFGVGGGMELLPPHLSPVLGLCVLIAGLIVMIVSGVVVTVGLIREGRKLPAGRKDKSGK